MPVRFTLAGDGFEVQPSAGGLAAALTAVRGDAVWIGWPGTVVPESLQPKARKQLEKKNLVPIFLSADEEEDFYGRVCNDTLWPLFHYFCGPAPHHTRGLAALRARQRTVRRRDPRALGT